MNGMHGLVSAAGAAAPARAPERAAAPAGALCTAVLEHCEAALSCLDPGPVRDTVRRVADRLAEPTLRIAVGGRLKAGKSTLVNALLGQNLAPTDATECTRTVAWFRYSHQNSVQVTPREGEPYRVLPGPGGTIPADLGRDPRQIAGLTIEVSNDILRRYHTIADTPGLDTLTDDGALDADSLAALRQCDALVFVMPHPGQQEMQALDAVRAATASCGLGLANAVGVLSRIDQLGEGVGDPWEQACRISARYARRLRAQLADVIPVAGLLAETALGGSFTEGDARTLRDLAAGTDLATRERILYRPEDWLAADTVALDTPSRVRLLRMLGLYGIAQSLDLLDAGPMGAARLLRHYRRDSGIDPLLDFIRTRFVADADALRAGPALAELDQVVWGGATEVERQALTRLRSALAAVRSDPALHRARLSGILADLDAGRLRLPDWAEHDLVDLVRGASAAGRVGLSADAAPAEAAAAADERISRWRGLESDYRIAVARAAAAVRESFEALYYTLARS